MLDFEKIAGFQWDEGNSGKNFKKHSVTDFEAEQIFLNEPLLVADDDSHSTLDELRYSALGVTDSGKNLAVIFTIRKDLIRIISARIMSKNERKIYNEKT